MPRHGQQSSVVIKYNQAKYISKISNKVVDQKIYILACEHQENKNSTLAIISKRRKDCSSLLLKS